MDVEEYLDFKVYLQWKEEQIIRRFSVNKKFSNNFQFLVNRIKAAFPEVNSRTFQVMWNDSEDMVCISSNEELILALSEMDEPLKKIYVKCVGKINNGGDELQLRVPNTTSKIVSKVKRDKQLSQKNKHDKRKTYNSMESQTNTALSNSQDVSKKHKGFEYTDCIGKLNDNIEQMRLHLINPDGTISEHHNETKLQALQLSLKKLQCIVDKLQDTRTPETIVNTILFPDLAYLRENPRWIASTQINNTNTASSNSTMRNETIDTDDQQNVVVSDELNNDNSPTPDDYGCEMIDDNVENGSSVKTLSQVSSDEEDVDKWTFLDNENHMELESLPDVTSRLEELKNVNQDNSQEAEDQNVDSLSETMLPVNSGISLPTIHIDVPVERTVSMEATVLAETTVPVHTMDSEDTTISVEITVPVMTSVSTGITVPVETTVPMETMVPTSTLVSAERTVPVATTVSVATVPTMATFPVTVSAGTTAPTRTTVPVVTTSPVRNIIQSIISVVNDVISTPIPLSAPSQNTVPQYTIPPNTMPQNPTIPAHLAAGLEILYSMGFDNESRNLLGLLEAYDGNVELVLDTILFTDL